MNQASGSAGTSTCSRAGERGNRPVYARREARVRHRRDRGHRVARDHRYSHVNELRWGISEAKQLTPLRR